MIIKKYVGKTESEATEEAKRELGQNIVVMNVKPMKKTGFFSFFQTQKIEVTVALEEETEKPARTTYSPQPRTVSPDNSQKDTIISATANSTKVKTDSRVKEDNSAIEEKLDNLSNLLEKNFLKNDDDESTKSTKVTKEKDSFDNTDDASLKSNGKTDIPEDTMSFIKLLYNTLIENEVDEIYVNQLTDEVEKISKPGLPFDYALANVYQKMVLKFGKSEPIDMEKPGPRAEIFIGPTGVGKTTTIAKLASELSVTQKKKVALLTVDTYRIAAAEQLRTYASILEIPFRVIYSIDEMKQAAEDFKDYDFIMVDTAGHSLHNEELKQGVESFIRVLEDAMECENFLVLSATTKYRDLIEIADAYSEMVAYRLIFTKMDETGAKGNLYNVRMHTGAPVAYITNGQNVPDDIAIFDAQRIVKNLLGGKS